MHKGSAHVFSEIFLHLNFHCHRDRPMIRSEIEPALHEAILAFCRATKGAHPIAVGGTESHIHLVFQMEPLLNLSQFIGQVKGRSAHDINEQFGRDTLRWQRGFGIVSFAKRNLPGLVAYVTNQKQHHAAGTTREILEQYNRWIEGAQDEGSGEEGEEGRGASEDEEEKPR